VPLPAATWRARHKTILSLLWIHPPIIVAFGLYVGETLGHSLLEASVVALAALAASVRLPLPARWEPARRSLRATLAGFGLVTASAVLTHLSGGYIEMHFHFFVVVAVMALYQSWLPFLLAIVYVAVHHTVAGVLDPTSVYNHPAAIANPVQWAGIHAFFILCASAAAVTAWRFSEEARLTTEAANRDLGKTASLLGATLDATADGLLVVDREGRITSHNGRFAALWGIPARVLAARDDDKALAFVLDQLVDPAAFLAKVKELYAHPDAESFDVLHFKDGRILERVSRPQRLDGLVVGRVWSFRDVTEQRRAEQDRLLAGQRLMDIQRLEEINAFKTRLLNTASHELNTPLTPLRLQVHMLMEQGAGSLDDRQRRALGVLDRNLRRLSGLVGNILDVARLESDQMKLDVRPIDLGLLARDILDDFSEAAQRAGVQMSARVDGDVLAVADEERITQVLVNLASNALKFTPAGGHVTVRCEPSGDGVHVEVTDTGRGLLPDEAAALFQAFMQVGDPAKEAGGTGLGLYICKGIVEAHGGTIGVDSDGPTKGCTFWFTLPARPVANHRNTVPAVQAGTPPVQS
jgi:signal transduction histidine kinase